MGAPSHDFPEEGRIMSCSILRRSRLPLVVALLLLGGACLSTVHAQEVRWSYLEGGLRLEAKEHTDHDSGWFAGGSLGFGRFHFFADYFDVGHTETSEV